MDLRDKVHKDARNAKQNGKKSWDWYQTNVRNAAAGMSAQKFLGDNIAHQTKTVVPGNMIMFFYDPKTKEKLPYYDTFPLLLPFGATDKHFIGLNLHYLPPLGRALLLDSLLKYATDDNMKIGTKIELSWNLLKGSSEIEQIKPCVKQYLFSNVKSNYIVVPPKEWEFVPWLPLEMFKKADNETVWNTKR